jgi:hypothetical protein
MFENRLLCGPKREEIAGDWRKLRTVELHEFHCSPNIIGKDAEGKEIRS